MADDDDAIAELAPIEKAFEVVVAGIPVAGETTQQKPDRSTPEEALTPPLPLEALAKLSGINGVRSACIEAISLNVVGLGVDAVLGDQREAPEEHVERRAELLKLLDALAARDTRLDRPSFIEQLRAVKTDEEECGWGFLEVSRNRTTGRPDGLFHVPGARMRRLKDRSGFVLVGPGGSLDNAVRFYNYGEKVKTTPEGEPTADLEPGHRWELNEVLVFRLYSSESRDYGLPRDAALALEYAADKLAAESNVSFFDSSGVPPTVLFVMGEESRDGSGRVTFRVPQETVNRIAKTVKSDTGHQSAVAIVPLPAGAKVQSEQLAQRSDRDIGNNAFRGAIARRTLGTFRLGDIFVPAIESDGRYTAEVQRALALEQVFDPEQAKYEGTFSPLLRELGFADMGLKFKRLAVESDEARRDSANALALSAAITNRELRKAHGMGPLPEHGSDDEQAAAAAGKVPKGWNDRLVTSPKATGTPAFGGASEGSPFPGPDGRGLQAGVGSRPRQVPGEGGEPQQGSAGVAKSDGDDPEHVEAAVADLEVEYLDITADGVQRALRRTHTIADVVAGRVAEQLDRRVAEANGAAS